MASTDSFIGQRYRDESLEQARKILRQQDCENPNWMEVPLSPPRNALTWGESFFPNFLVQSVCTAVIVCLLISATTTRLTAKALTLAMETRLQTEAVDSPKR